MIPFILFISCATSEKDDTQDESIVEDSAYDTADDETPTEVDPSTLNGVAPNQELAVADFNALNSDGSVRDASNLTGNPTVIWFFPAADTPG
jgi:hypothetical protein